MKIFTQAQGPEAQERSSGTVRDLRNLRQYPKAVNPRKGA